MEPKTSHGEGPRDVLAGGSTYFFAWSAGQLERVGDPTDQSQGVRMNGQTGRLEFLGGNQAVVDDTSPVDVEVRIGIWLGVRGLYAGDVKVFTVNVPSTGPVTSPLPLRASVGVNSSVWRAIRIGELVDETIARVREGATAVSEMLPDDAHLTSVTAAEERRPTRGPRPGITPQLAAEVVAPAYLKGGRRPVIAVQEALESAGHPGSGPSGDVTIDQARKAVLRARDLGFLKPAEKKGGRR